MKLGNQLGGVLWQWCVAQIWQREHCVAVIGKKGGHKQNQRARMGPLTFIF